MARPTVYSDESADEILRRLTEGELGIVPLGRP